MIETDPLSPFSYKAKEEFQWEREFRIIIQQFPQAKISFDDALYCNCAEENPHSGIFLRVDLKRLIDKIVVAPHSSNEFYQAVQRLTEDFGLADRVTRSALEE